MRAGAETAALTAAALLAALLLFGGFVALRGVDPLAVYAALFVGAFGTRFSLEDTLTQAAPLMLTALCTAVPARAGLLVIGGEGALVVGGVATVLVGVALAGVAPSLAIAAMCAGGAVAGGLWIAAADPEGDQDLPRARLDGPIAVVVGSEGPGVRKGVLEHCDLRLRIPMLGQVASLNASVSAAILLYEVARQRLVGGK